MTVSVESRGTGLARLVIVPDQSGRWHEFWEIFVVILLFMTAYYEPFIVALLQRWVEGEKQWCIVFNHVLDMAFTLDIVLHFFLAYPYTSDSSSSDVWEK